MNKKQKSSPEDRLQAENEVLKLKLEMEHGMTGSETGDLSPIVENKFLKNVWEFENAFKNAKRVKLHDFIGKPAFKKAEELSKREISSELERLEKVMAKHQVALDCICNYPDETIYRFVTEELFEHEVDDVRIKGMFTHFTYEEFHPNHDYDLRKRTDEFISRLLEKEWSEDDCQFYLTETVSYNGKQYDAAGISAIIAAFELALKNFKVKKRKITQVNFDLEKKDGCVKVLLDITDKSKGNASKRYGSEIAIEFNLSYDWWSVSGFGLPVL